ncbi:hypothetical protein JXB27_03475 [Candidatus Woesearchaeota archaeon]|nr:hypothetical protein [Candidatus Woesearchaeota archaeon]
MTIRLTRANLVKGIYSYLKRPDIKKYPLNEKGLYEIVLSNESLAGPRPVMNEIFEGSYLEAIAYALTQEKFYAHWCDCKRLDERNSGHGYVRKVKPIVLSEKLSNSTKKYLKKYK